VNPSLQIPNSTWRAACRVLGRERAATCVALIYEKQQAGLIESPGAYLNGLISRAADNELNLGASLFYWNKPRKTDRRLS
jgi:replication initiation protein RepC